jgi:hypothetical protein
MTPVETGDHETTDCSQQLLAGYWSSPIIPPHFSRKIDSQQRNHFVSAITCSGDETRERTAATTRHRSRPQSPRTDGCRLLCPSTSDQWQRIRSSVKRHGDEHGRVHTRGPSGCPSPGPVLLRQSVPICRPMAGTIQQIAQGIDESRRAVWDQRGCGGKLLILVLLIVTGAALPLIPIAVIARWIAK